MDLFFDELMIEPSEDGRSLTVRYLYNYVHLQFAHNQVARQLKETISVSRDGKDYEHQIQSLNKDDQIAVKHTTRKRGVSDNAIVLGGQFDVPALHLVRSDAEQGRISASFTTQLLFDGDRKFKSTLIKAIELDDSLKHLEWLVGRWEPENGSKAIGIVPFGDSVGAGFRKLAIRPADDGKALIVTYIYEASDMHPFNLVRRAEEKITVSGDNEYKVVLSVKQEGVIKKGMKINDSMELTRERVEGKRFTLGGAFNMPVLVVREHDEKEGTITGNFTTVVRSFKYEDTTILKRVE